MNDAGDVLSLSNAPEQARLREVRAELEALRDEIASLDLEIENLRERLAAFEAMAQVRLGTENARLGRVRRLLEHLERWRRLLSDASVKTFVQRAQRVERRRVKEVRQEAARQSAATEPPTESFESADEALEQGPEEAADTLKALYRSLARKFHPDLARSEEERLRFSALMSKINGLYAERDLARLRALHEQQQGGELDDSEDAVVAQLEKLEERLRWFRRVLANLEDERAELLRHPTCALLKQAEAHAAKKRDVFDSIRRELSDETEHALNEISIAARRLENEVERFNRDAIRSALASAKGKQRSELDTLFDPFANKRLVRTGLAALKVARVSPAAKEKAVWVEALAEDNPALLRLILFSYAQDLSPMPLLGLEKLEDLKLRFEHIQARDRKRPRLRLEEVLAEATSYVEYGIRKVVEGKVRTGLLFRDASLREALPSALRSVRVKEEFRHVLEALGDRLHCKTCEADVFAVPLFRTRGLDDLRAAVCPACGSVLRSYWMPKGEDIQSILNDAFLELEVVTEWSFRMARASVALQLLPIQLEEMTVADLRGLFWADVLKKNGLEVAKGQVHLLHGKKEVDPELALADLDPEDRTFTVKLDKASGLTVTEALERVRYRIRNRFRPDAR